jgi:uncharacterized protein YcbK (DUF882 family)
MRTLVVSTALALALAASIAPPPALAETTHTVAKGHTLHAIARRYKVSEVAILEANDLKNPRALRPGTELVIPSKGDAKKKGKKSADHRSSSSKTKSGKGETGEGRTAGVTGLRGKELTSALFSSKPPASKYAKAAKHPHVVQFRRLGETFQIRVQDRRGKIPQKALRDFEKIMRSGDATHSANPRLVALLGIVSDHFGSRSLEVVSGFRPASSGQYTPHSKHNFGRALDFKVQGVPNEALRDYCKTFKNVGVGYYPNSTFVHLDVRDNSAFWTDYSRPGEAPDYEGNHSKDADDLVSLGIEPASEAASETERETGREVEVDGVAPPKGSSPVEDSEVDSPKASPKADVSESTDSDR